MEQVTHYYPFGGVIADISTNQALQPYKYNGKELDRMHGLDWYDYGARYYDAALGQFWRFDPLLEKYYPWNPYGYCDNDPIKYIDIEGKEKLNGLSPQDKDTKFLIQDYLHYKDQINSIHVWGHGDLDNIFINIHGYGKIDSAEKFLNYLNENSVVWQSGKKVPIILHSCYNAKFAELLSKSKEFENVEIIGAEGAIEVIRNKVNKSYLGSRVNGFWLGYINGEIVDYWYSNDQPKSIFESLNYDLFRFHMDDIYFNWNE